MRDRRLIAWWRAKTLREQRLMLAAGALAAVVLAWLVLVRPMGDALADAKERHSAAVVRLAETRAAVERHRKAASGVPVPLAGSLDAILAASATEAGFPVARVDRASASQATIVIEAVRPPAFFAWVARMEAERGLAVERLTATANSDQTLAVQATFRTRG